mgnify:CR=1 FL=1
MNKPFTIKTQEAEQKIVEIINNSQLPAYALKNILQGIYAEIDRVDNEEIAKYNEEQEKSQKKESDK